MPHAIRGSPYCFLGGFLLLRACGLSVVVLSENRIQNLAKERPKRRMRSARLTSCPRIVRFAISLCAPSTVFHPSMVERCRLNAIVAGNSQFLWKLWARLFPNRDICSHRYAEPGRATTNSTSITSDIQTLINRAPRWTVPEKGDLVLEMMARMTDKPGSQSKFEASRDYPLVAARDPQEVAWIIEALADRRFLEGVTIDLGTMSSARGTLTLKGWERVAELRQAGPNSRFVFVAMSFSGALSNLYDGAIAPAVRQAGYEPIRVDRKEHANPIDDEIVGSIRRSRFMVADFTGQRAGVYFEAGMMTGLGRTVIWMCDKRELREVHFDVRQRNFIDWDSVEDARQRLYKRILAIEGEGPDAAQP